MGHAIVERVLLFGTRPADYIRASSHSGCIAMEASSPFENRPYTWLHPNASQNVRFLLHRGRRPYMAHCVVSRQRSKRTLSGGEFNRSTQHPSLERTDCWCRSNFSIKSQDIRHRSRSFERLRRYPPILAALPALSALCLQLRHEPCPCMSLHMHAIPTWRIRVKGCCVDRLSPPGHSDRWRRASHRH